jgi:hypothetical protein
MQLDLVRDDDEVIIPNVDQGYKACDRVSYKHDDRSNQYGASAQAKAMHKSKRIEDDAIAINSLKHRHNPNQIRD